MVAALQAATDGHEIIDAAKAYGVPRLTLYDRVAGRVYIHMAQNQDPTPSKAKKTELSW